MNYQATSLFLAERGMAMYEDDYVKSCKHCGHFLPDDADCDCRGAVAAQTEALRRKSENAHLFLVCSLLFLCVCLLAYSLISFFREEFILGVMLWLSGLFIVVRLYLGTK